MNSVSIDRRDALFAEHWPTAEEVASGYRGFGEEDGPQVAALTLLQLCEGDALGRSDNPRAYVATAVRNALKRYRVWISATTSSGDLLHGLRDSGGDFAALHAVPLDPVPSAVVAQEGEEDDEAPDFEDAVRRLLDTARVTDIERRALLMKHGALRHKQLTTTDAAKELGRSRRSITLARSRGIARIRASLEVA